MEDSRLRRGRHAERIAANFLALRGYRIIEWNRRERHDEIDLIAEHGEWIVFVEVKLRWSCAFGGAVQAVDGLKKRRLLRAARAYLARRFPALANAPLLTGHVCQYENSPDGHYIVDRLPSAPNAWVVGGGSGHGFKVGPALGEMVSGLVLDDRDPPVFFSLTRLSRIARRRG